eukprot:2751545-Lingulodinium_polyedra.AAC.1
MTPDAHPRRISETTCSRIANASQTQSRRLGSKIADRTWAVWIAAPLRLAPILQHGNVSVGSG